MKANRPLGRPPAGHLVVKPVQLRPGSAQARTSVHFKAPSYRFWEKIDLKTRRQSRHTVFLEPNHEASSVISAKAGSSRENPEEFRIQSDVYKQYAAIGSRGEYRKPRKTRKKGSLRPAQAVHRRVNSLGNSNQVFDYQTILNFTSRSKLLCN